MQYFKELSKNDIGDEDFEDITVENNNKLESCIKYGVRLKARNVYVKGNVDQSNIIASNAYIEGQTHSRSNIKAAKVYVKHCKGKIIADCVVVDNLEGGVIRARKVYIDTCVSGKIIADYIYIKNCLSYNEICAKRYLVLDEISGDMNTFEINPEKFLREANSKDFFQKQLTLNQLENKLKHTVDRLNEAKAFIVKNCHNIYKIKKIKEKNTIYQKNISLYNSVLEKYQEYFGRYQDIVRLLYVVKTQVNSVLHMAFNGKIILIKDNKGADNLIKFTIMDNKKNKDYRHILKNDFCRVFYLYKHKNPSLRSHEDINQENLSWIENIKKDVFED
ncbi:hypothetical protein A0Y59_05115 [Campylobacter lari]|uniref:DUF342 domain-containing protein n=1 Tax=Campylobacter lari TaxID=201 RepID=A0A7U8G237_CAMLA|nr:hypothetical protein [Campylobacter lari]